MLKPVNDKKGTNCKHTGHATKPMQKHYMVHQAAGAHVYLSRSWHWESVQLEGVCTVSMRGLLFQILWQVDDHYSIERTFLRHGGMR